MKEKEIPIVYLDAHQIWDNITNRLLSDFLERLKVNYTWISNSSGIISETSLEGTIKRISYGTSVNSAYVVKIIDKKNFHVWYLIPNPPSDLITQIKRMNDLKAFL